MSDSHDPWEEARAAQREQVKAIFAEREPAAEVERHRPFRLSRRNTLIVAGVVALLAVATAIVVPILRDQAAGERQAQRERQARLEAADRARLRIEVRPVRAAGPAVPRGADPLALRPRQVTAGEAAISADARARMRQGTIDGPVAGTQCTTYPTTEARRTLEADTSVAKGRYECVAYERKFPLSELEGQARTGIIGVPYWLVIDYRSSQMTFCKITPKAGEGGKSLAYVPVPVPCRDPVAG